jgi:hypothetical protein
MVYEVCGLFYTESALNWLVANEMATKTETGFEVWTQPIEWDHYTTPEHWNPDIVEVYCRDHVASSILDVQRQIAKLGLTWVELPSIEPYNQDETNHLMMLRARQPMLPGFSSPQRGELEGGDPEKSPPP